MILAAMALLWNASQAETAAPRIATRINVDAAEAALRRAEGLRWNAVTRVCRDAGRAAELRKLNREFSVLTGALLATHQRSVGRQIIMDDRSDCEAWGDYRELANAYRLALLDARDALGLEE